MQNPFERLSKYREGLSDPQENRATEALAACLVLSVEVRREFLSFLFDGKRNFSSLDAECYEVSTQAQTDDGKWVDLFVENDGEESIVVEVKVKAKRDGSQIEKYVGWLKNTRAWKRSVFHLVKVRDSSFDIAHHGGDRSHTWKELYDYFNEHLEQRTFEATDANIIEYFCEFLEREGIVNTWKPKEILAYGPGLKAKEALESLFEQVGNRFKDLNEDYDPKPMMPKGQWPRLEVGRACWKAIFGDEGYHNKVYAFYENSGAWKGEAERFYFELVLWSRDHGCNWDITKPMVAQWLERLKSEGFTTWVKLRGGRLLETDIESYKFNEAPTGIGACSLNNAMKLISAVQIEAMTSDELVNAVFEQVKRHCDIVSQLGAAKLE